MSRSTLPQDLHASPAPLASTSQTLPPAPAWTALLANLLIALGPPSWLTALTALLASMLQQGCAPPALLRSTSPTLPPAPAWTALLASSPLALALHSWLTALTVLLASMLQQECAPPALLASTSLPLAPPSASPAPLASISLPLAPPRAPRPLLRSPRQPMSCMAKTAAEAI